VKDGDAFPKRSIDGPMKGARESQKLRVVNGKKVAFRLIYFSGKRRPELNPPRPGEGKGWAKLNVQKEKIFRLLCDGRSDDTREGR